MCLQSSPLKFPPSAAASLRTKERISLKKWNRARKEVPCRADEQSQRRSFVLRIIIIVIVWFSRVDPLPLPTSIAKEDYLFFVIIIFIHCSRCSPISLVIFVWLLWSFVFLLVLRYVRTIGSTRCARHEWEMDEKSVADTNNAECRCRNKIRRPLHMMLFDCE